MIRVDSFEVSNGQAILRLTTLGLIVSLAVSHYGYTLEPGDTMATKMRRIYDGTDILAIITKPPTHR